MRTGSGYFTFYNGSNGTQTAYLSNLGDLQIDGDAQVSGNDITFGASGARISVDDFDQTFEYGQDGKPFFIQGPYETPQRVDQIIASLTRNCGEDNFHYLLEISE